MSKQIIYTGEFRFPNGDAGAARVLGIGKALRKAGYDVVFAGWEDRERSEDFQSDGGHAYQEFRYWSQGDLRCTQLSPLKRLFRYIMAGSNTLRWLRSIDLSDVKAIIAYHGGSLFLFRLNSFCKKNGIKLIVDCTEWYDARHLVGGRFGLVSLDNEIRMRLINTWIGVLLPISSYLENYYLTKGCRVLRIPPLVDLDESKWVIPDNIIPTDKSGLRLTYAGTPAKKDLLGNALRGLSILKDEGITVELHLIGPTRDDVTKCLDNDAFILDYLGDAITFYGRVSQSDVPHLIANCDFSLLLRPLERYAQAGFSTKLVESLAAGVPVIANPTSDIKGFIRDGIEGLLLADHSPEAFVVGVKRALNIPQAQRQVMRSNARLLAETSFDCRVYVKQLRTFMHECTN